MYRSILVPLDGSAFAEQALPLACEIAATQRGVDLIVMATHGYGGLQRWALGSVADKVLHVAPMAVLLVRAQPSTGERQRTNQPREQEHPQA